MNNVDAPKDDVVAKLALKTENKELEYMKKELALTSRLHSARLHNSDEENDGFGKINGL